MNQNVELKVGDIVQLKSGGPKMTIENIRDGEICCTWFDAQGARQFSHFDPRVLRVSPSMRAVEVI